MQVCVAEGWVLVSKEGRITLLGGLDIGRRSCENPVVHLDGSACRASENVTRIGWSSVTLLILVTLVLRSHTDWYDSQHHLQEARGLVLRFQRALVEQMTPCTRLCKFGMHSASVLHLWVFVDVPDSGIL